MVDVESVVRIALTLMRFSVFGLALGLTIISFQSYQENRTTRLQYAFMGFAFISMGVAVTSIITQIGDQASEQVLLFLQVVETIPFIVGFSLLYLSLYR